ncbi:MAG TPA: TraB/VirB10 family protein, partial [Planctomycetota bacterium]|nr:TraB/VirB10 family protein [Planctomycetota bacterium]
MSTVDRPSLLAFMTKTKTGRMILLVTFLGGILVLVPMVLAKKKGTQESSPGAKTPSGDKTNGGGELPPSPTGFGDTLTLGQKYDALISRFGGDLSTTKAELDSTRRELEALRTTLRAGQTTQAEDKKSLVDALRQLKEGLGQPGPAQSREISHEQGRGTPNGATGGLRSIELAAPAPKEKKEKRPVRIPTASGGFATLMNGVFAPVTGEPSPVRLRFDAAILGPNKARIPLRDSFLIGKATGDPNGCRVSIQIEKFSTVKEKGEAIETKALGFVVGEDGLEGVPGTYEWRAWEYLPLAVGTGGLQGLSGALSQTQMTTTLNPLGGATNVLTGDSMKLAGYQAMGGASAKLGDIVAERMKEIKPAISTPADRKVTVVFLDGVTLE